MCTRARTLLASGIALEALAPPRLRVQLALYRLGGEAILDAIAAAGYNTATHRPAVDRAARVRIVAAALSAGVRRGAPREVTVAAAQPLGERRA
jgi:hypothetical protein